MPTSKTVAIVLTVFVVLSIAIGIVVVVLWSSGGGPPHREPVKTVSRHRTR
jgi:hypothetical protein